jgi:type I restriction-modification system DNA methylase subunit/restriction endonuclease S subunit
LGFSADSQEVSDVLHKTYGENGEAIRIDFSKQSIEYPQVHGFKINRADTCNFSSSENAVVLECVHRLLEKGYKPQHIELEPEWKLGHGGKSGRADILVRDQQGAALLIIECKTAGREFDKAWKDTLEDGAQLISYVEQEKATQFICLYASEFDAKAGQVKTSQRIISVKDNPQILLDQPKAQSFKDATNAKERFKAWKDTYRQEFTEVGIFEGNIQPYQIGKSKYTFADDTRPLQATDIQGKYHHFRTILRKHNVSRRENAFEVLVNLFVCKIVDEMEHPDDLRFYWKGIAYDNYYDLVDRLQALYKTGMQRFLDQDIVYVSNADIDQAFWPVKKKRNAVKDEIKRLFRELKFFKGMDFEFIKVFNQTYFDRNAKILIEIIQMWQGYRLTGSSQNQFLGDMFEYFLDNGIKQSEGQFFTPVPICKFIVSSLPLEQLIANTSEPLRAIDYACGSGHFLTEYAAQLPALLQAHKQQANTSKWYAGIYGIEKEDRLAKVAKVSAFMYGFNDIHILDADALVRHPDITEAGHDILVANPPFSVEDFLQTVPEDERERYTLLANANDLGNKNVQCFFLERAQQLLKPGAVMGVIVPSSILSNTDGMHVATRQILLKYFDFVAITELGGSTFGKTGTNTVVLFMRRKSQRPEAAEHLANRVQDYFEDWATEAQTGGGEYQDLDTVRQYCAHIGVAFEHYASLLQGQPSAELLSTDIFKDYRRAFDEATETKKRIASKDFQKQGKAIQEMELSMRLVDFCRQREQTKLFYYMLAAHNPTPVLLVKGPSDNKAQQQFLGYEWSGAKGQEGIRYIGGESVRDIATPLFDPTDRSNASKISHVIRQAFAGEALHIPTELQAYVSQAPLTDLLEFGRVEFDAVLSLTVKKSLAVISQWPMVRLADISELRAGKFISASAIKNEFFEDSYPCYGGNGLRGYVESFTHEGEYSLIGRQGALCGNVFFAKGKFHATEHAVVVTANPNANKKWLHYKLISLELNQYATGVAQPGLSVERLNSLTFGLPPLNIQHQIVAECEAIDQSVEESKADIEQHFHQINRSLAGAAQISQKDKLANIAQRISDSIDPQQHTGSVVYFGLENIESQTGKKTGSTASTYNAIKSTKTCFKAGDVLYGKLRPNLNKVHLATEDGICSTDIYVLRFSNAALANIFVHYLRSKPFNDAVLKTVSGQQLPRTSWTAMGQIPVPVFTAAQQTALLGQVDAANQAITAAQATIAAAPAQKQAVLQRHL